MLVARGRETKVTSRHEPPRVVLCEDDPVLRRWVARLAEDAGVEVVATTEHWARALEQIVEHEADAVVIDLATVGRVGVRLVRALRRLAPNCDVLVISPLRTIDLAVEEAGAAAVASPSDLRPLAAALLHLRNEPHPAT
jgi:DNA-binding NtrC family response regulator